jgi:hypothetical protein
MTGVVVPGPCLPYLYDVHPDPSRHAQIPGQSGRPLATSPPRPLTVFLLSPHPPRNAVRVLTRIFDIRTWRAVGRGRTYKLPSKATAASLICFSRTRHETSNCRANPPQQLERSAQPTAPQRDTSNLRHGSGPRLWGCPGSLDATDLTKGLGWEDAASGYRLQYPPSDCQPPRPFFQWCSTYRYPGRAFS